MVIIHALNRFVPLQSVEELLAGVRKKAYKLYESGAVLTLDCSEESVSWYLTAGADLATPIYVWPEGEFPGEAFLKFGVSKARGRRKVVSALDLEGQRDELPRTQTWKFSAAKKAAVAKGWAHAQECAKTFMARAHPVVLDIASWEEAPQVPQSVIGALTPSGLAAARTLKARRDIPMVRECEKLALELVANSLATVNPSGYLQATSLLSNTPLPAGQHLKVVFVDA